MARAQDVSLLSQTIFDLAETIMGTLSNETSMLSEALITSHASTIKFAELAIKSLLILNGGAAIAVLSFAGAQLKSGSLAIEAYSSGMQTFGFGAGLAVLTAGTSYLAQHFFSHMWDRTGTFLQCLSVAIWLGGLTAFGMGVNFSTVAVRTGAQKCEQSQPAKTSNAGAGAMPRLLAENRTSQHNS
jgi:hypothetical protein